MKQLFKRIASVTVFLPSVKLCSFGLFLWAASEELLWFYYLDDLQITVQDKCELWQTRNSAACSLLRVHILYRSVLLNISLYTMVLQFYKVIQRWLTPFTPTDSTQTHFCTFSQEGRVAPSQATHPHTRPSKLQPRTQCYSSACVCVCIQRSLTSLSSSRSLPFLYFCHTHTHAVNPPQLCHMSYEIQYSCVPPRHTPKTVLESLKMP